MTKTKRKKKRKRRIKKRRKRKKKRKTRIRRTTRKNKKKNHLFCGVYYAWRPVFYQGYQIANIQKVHKSFISLIHLSQRSKLKKGLEIKMRQGVFFQKKKIIIILDITSKLFEIAMNNLHTILLLLLRNSC